MTDWNVDAYPPISSTAVVGCAVAGLAVVGTMFPCGGCDEAPVLTGSCDPAPVFSGVCDEAPVGTVT